MDRKRYAVIVLGGNTIPRSIVHELRAYFCKAAIHSHEQ